MVLLGDTEGEEKDVHERTKHSTCSDAFFVRINGQKKLKDTFGSTRSITVFNAKSRLQAV